MSDTIINPLDLPDMENNFNDKMKKDIILNQPYDLYISDVIKPKIKRMYVIPLYETIYENIDYRGVNTNFNPYDEFLSGLSFDIRVDYLNPKSKVYICKRLKQLSPISVESGGNIIIPASIIDYFKTILLVKISNIEFQLSNIKIADKSEKDITDIIDNVKELIRENSLLEGIDVEISIKNEEEYIEYTSYKFYQDLIEKNKSKMEQRLILNNKKIEDIKNENQRLMQIITETEDALENLNKPSGSTPTKPFDSTALMELNYTGDSSVTKFPKGTKDVTKRNLLKKLREFK